MSLVFFPTNSVVRAVVASNLLSRSHTFSTGGVRCERASALLKYKMETEPDTKDLGIKGVYQLQGGIDKYFKDIPDGGFWKGKVRVSERTIFLYYSAVANVFEN